MLRAIPGLRHDVQALGRLILGQILPDTWIDQANEKENHLSNNNKNASFPAKLCVHRVDRR